VGLRRQVAEYQSGNPGSPAGQPGWGGYEVTALQKHSADGGYVSNFQCVAMLLAAPTDVVALNFFFDTLLFSGAILLFANSIDKEPAVARI
jgi:hypothetical protein